MFNCVRMAGLRVTLSPIRTNCDGLLSMTMTCIRDHLKRVRGHIHASKRCEWVETTDRHMIDNKKRQLEGDSVQNPATVRDGPTIQSTTETVKNGGTVREMVIGVGRGRLRECMYGIGTGAPRTRLGRTGMCISFRPPHIRS